MQKILRLPTVISITGRARSTIYLDIQRGQFPEPITLGQRSVGWLESDINQWIEKRINESRSSKETRHAK